MQIEDSSSCIENVCDSQTRSFLCSNCHYDKFDQNLILHLVRLKKNPRRNFKLLVRYFFSHDVKIFEKEKMVYTSFIAIIRESGSYDVSVKILIFIFLLQKAIQHMGTLYVTLLRISNLIGVNVII